MRRLLFSLSLGLCACSGQQVVSQSTASALPSNYEDIVMAVLEEHVTDVTSYCLKILGQPPAEELVAALRDYGHEPLSCNPGAPRAGFRRNTSHGRGALCGDG
jgi:hypothetical protein